MSIMGGASDLSVQRVAFNSQTEALGAGEGAVEGAVDRQWRGQWRGQRGWGGAVLQGQGLMGSGRGRKRRGTAINQRRWV